MVHGDEERGGPLADELPARERADAAREHL